MYKYVKKIGLLNVIRKVYYRYKYAYKKFIASEAIPTVEVMSEAIQQFKYEPMISVVMPIYKPNLLEFSQAIQSILGQTYQCFELCLVDDGSDSDRLDAILQSMQLEYPGKIKYKKNKKNGGISAASNDAIHMANGDYIALVDQDDMLAPHAFFEIVQVLQEQKYDFIYSDEDMVNADNKRFNPQFKTDWAPHSLLSRMYVNHLSVYKKECIDQSGGFSSAFDGSQDYELLLKTMPYIHTVRHIDKVLYHWRTSEQSIASDIGNKSYIYEKASQAIKARFQDFGLPVAVSPHDEMLIYDVDFHTDTEPLTLLLFQRDNTDGCGLDAKKNEFEKKLPNVHQIITIKNWLDVEQALEHVDTNHMLFYDIRAQVTVSVIQQLQAMLKIPNIATVSPRIEDQQARILSSGLIFANRGRVLSSGFGETDDNPGYYGRNISLQNASASMPYCLMTTKKVFMDLLGMQQSLTEDILINLILLQLSSPKNHLLHVVNGGQKLQVGRHEFKRDLKRLQNKRVAAKIEQFMSGKNDPFYNTNLVSTQQALFRTKH